MSVRSTGAPPPLPRAVPFTTAIPLDGNRTLPRTFVSGPLAFTPGPGANGGQAVLPLVADGVSAVTFPGFTEYGGSAGYDNAPGLLNLIQFFHLDDTPYVCVTQAVDARPTYPPATAYTLTGPAIARVGAPAAFTLRANGVLASPVTVTPGDGGGGGTLSPATATLPAGTATSATFTYTPSSAGTRTLGVTNAGGLTDPPGLTVTAVADAYLRLTGLGGLIESADGPGYDYAATSNSVYDGGYAVSAVAIPAGQDGYMGAAVSGLGTCGMIVGLKTAGSSGPFTTLAYGAYADTSAKPYYQIIDGGGGGGVPDVQLPVAVGDLLRLRRAGTSIVAEVSKDGGQSYAAVRTWTGATAAALYGGFQVSNTALPIKLPFASSNAA